jgi:hypothetical protein
MIGNKVAASIGAHAKQQGEDAWLFATLRLLSSLETQGATVPDGPSDAARMVAMLRQHVGEDCWVVDRFAQRLNSECERCRR